MAAAADEPAGFTEHMRTSFEAMLTAAQSDRRAGISDEEWELRLALGVGVSGGR